MSKIQKALDALQPYVIGIRYLEGTILIDAVFKEGWAVLDEPLIKKVKGDEGLNYYMIFSEDKNIELDDLLDYIHKVINYNIEREKKHDLLRAKVNELKEIFKKTPYKKLEKLQFTFTEDDLVPNLEDFDVDDELDEEVIYEKPYDIEEEKIQETIIDSPEQPITYLDENKKPIELTEEEMEILEEEARAERNRKIMANKKSPVSNLAKKVELPPKRKPQMVTTNEEYDTDCDCGEYEACEKCINKKDL
jgi:hypothetical protein